MVDSGEISGIGSRIRRYRTENGESANSLAEKLKERFGTGCPSRQMIANLETGQKKDITVTELLQFAQVLGVSPVALICDVEQPWEPADTPTVNGARNQTVYEWFDVHDYQPFQFDENGGAQSAVLPASRRLRALTTDLEAMRDARMQSRDSWDLFKRVAAADARAAKAGYAGNDPAIAETLKEHSTTRKQIAENIKHNLQDRYGMHIPSSES